MKLPITIGSPKGPTVEGAPAEMLTELLRELDESLTRAGFPVDRLLLPGSDEGSIRAAVARVGLIAPDELVAWFSWHEGSARLDAARPFVPGCTLWSLESVLSLYEKEPLGEEEWNPNWLQVIGPNVGIAVYCDSDAAAPPLLRSVAPDSEFGTQPNQTARQVVSLCTPVAWWLDSLANGWYEWQAQVGRWHSDRMRQSAIRAMHGLS